MVVHDVLLKHHASTYLHYGVCRICLDMTYKDALLVLVKRRIVVARSVIIDGLTLVVKETVQWQFQCRQLTSFDVRHVCCFS